MDHGVERRVLLAGAGLPQPMCIGRVSLADDSDVSRFLVEPAALSTARDITEHGVWQAYLTSA